MPLKGFDEFKKELSGIKRMTKEMNGMKFSSKAELERESQKIARRCGVSSKRALELSKVFGKTFHSN